MIEMARLGILGNVAVDKPYFAILDPTVCLGKRNRPGSQALHLAPAQHDPAFQRVEHQKIMLRLPVLGYYPFVVLGRGLDLFILILTHVCYFSRRAGPLANKEDIPWALYFS